jgi:hypothetical protein
MLQTEPRSLDFVSGDITGLPVPAHPGALSDAGASFLTQAFRRFGALGEDNAVSSIAAITPCPGGSTGVKLFLDVTYERPDPALHTRLFVKFSRDFSDTRRDEPGKWEMQSEVPFMWVARAPGFPIAIPKPYFADFENRTGTGIVITQCVPYGEGAIEPHRIKTLDHRTLGDPLPYYRATVTALARLAAAHKSGRLAPDIEAQFPFDRILGSADRIRYTPGELRAELAYGTDFAARCSRLLPDAVRAPGFQAKMAADAQRILAHEDAIQSFLVSDPRFHALCHWNAHIDNCWFERAPDGAITCGLIDWGRVGQITLGSVLWGGLSAAHHDIWDHHLDELLALFASEYHAGGGPLITPEELRFNLTLHIAAMGIARVLAFPEIITFRQQACAEAEGPHDAMFEGSAEGAARNTLHVYTVFLKLWLREDFGAALDRLLEDENIRVGH